MKDRMKDDAIWRKHYELEKASRNHECNDNNYLNDTLDKHIESISDCDIIEESDERKRK